MGGASSDLEHYCLSLGCDKHILPHGEETVGHMPKKAYAVYFFFGAQHVHFYLSGGEKREQPANNCLLPKEVKQKAPMPPDG